jgi:hypothetical protein
VGGDQERRDREQEPRELKAASNEPLFSSALASAYNLSTGALALGSGCSFVLLHAASIAMLSHTAHHARGRQTNRTVMEWVPPACRTGKERRGRL